MHPDLLAIWRFVRGDTAPDAFEQWVYAQTSLEEFLGHELFMRSISTVYGDRDAVWRLRADLEQFARAVTSMTCECVALSDTAVLDMADPGPARDHFAELRGRGEPYWWLHLEECTVCGTRWLVAQEERQNDVFLLRRLEGDEATAIVERDVWPTDFDRYETLLRLSLAAGHSARFLDPIGDSSLEWTMRDLARERPGIRVAELAELLNIDISTAMIIAREAVHLHSAEINLA